MIKKNVNPLENLFSGAPSFRSWHIPEPMLIFGGGNLCEDPKAGLAQYGPAALSRGPRTSLRVGIVGTGDLISLVRDWIEKARGPIYPTVDKRGKPYDPILATAFPGFSANSPFKCELDLDQRLQESIPSSRIDEITRIVDPRERVGAACALIMNRIAALAERDPAPDVIILALPDALDKSCGPRSRIKSHLPPLSPDERKRLKLERDFKRTGQRSIFEILDESDTDSDEHEELPLGIDLHDMIKARAMGHPIATQFVWESTIRRTRSTQDEATVAWNFFAALCYKCGNTPWELHLPDKETCYVGVSFYLDRHDINGSINTSLAQVFSQNGDGFILRGQPARIDKSRDRKAHLTQESAQRLLSEAVHLYERQEHRKPKRVVVHKTSRFWEEELAGFRSALGNVYTYDFLAIEQRGIRFVRLGQEPPLRGTVVELTKRDYLVYTHGYVPFIRCYPGMRIPNPIEVVEHHGDSDPERVCSELIALTKLNWNNCGYANTEPITIGFARRVGDILKEMPSSVNPQAKYKYYM